MPATPDLITTTTIRRDTELELRLACFRLAVSEPVGKSFAPGALPECREAVLRRAVEIEALMRKVGHSFERKDFAFDVVAAIEDLALWPLSEPEVFQLSMWLSGRAVEPLTSLQAWLQKGAD